MPGHWLADLARRLQTLGGLGGRHPDVGEHHVRPQRGDQLQQLLRVPGGADHVQAGVGQHPAQSLAQQHGVLGDDHPQRCRRRGVTGTGSPPPAGSRRPAGFDRRVAAHRRRPGRPGRAAPIPPPGRAPRRPVVGDLHSDPSGSCRIATCAVAPTRAWPRWPAPRRPRSRRWPRSGPGAARRAPHRPWSHRRPLHQGLDGSGQPGLGQDRRVDAAGQLPQLGQGLRASFLAARAAPPGSGSAPAARLRAMPSARLKVTSRCCAPSCRSRSMRRRSASPASTIRAREARTCSSWACTSAWRRECSSARPAAAAVTRTSSGSCRSSSSWTSTASAGAAGRIGQRGHDPPGSGRAGSTACPRCRVARAVRHPEGELQGRVTQGPGQRVPEPTRRRAGLEVHDRGADRAARGRASSVLRHEQGRTGQQDQREVAVAGCCRPLRWRTGAGWCSGHGLDRGQGADRGGDPQQRDSWPGGSSPGRSASAGRSGPPRSR